MAPDLEERAERLGLWMPRQDLQDVSLYSGLFDNPLPAGERSQDTDGFISRLLGNSYVRTAVVPLTTGSLAFLLSCGDMRSPASYQTQNYGTEQVSQKKIQTKNGAIIYDEQLGNAVFRGKNGSYSLFQNEKPQPDIGRLLQDEDSRASKPTLLGEQSSIPGVDIESEEFWAGLAPLTGDFDNNKIVQFKDFLGFVANYGTSNSLYDINKNGIVDFADFLMFVSQYGIAQMQDTIESKAFIDGTVALTHPLYVQPNRTFMRFKGSGENDIAGEIGDFAAKLAISAGPSGEDVVTYRLAANKLREAFPDGNIGVTVKVVDPRGNHRYQGNVNMEVPEFYFNGGLVDGRADFTLPNPLPKKVMLDVLGSSPDMTYKALVNDLLRLSHGGILGKIDISSEARSGNNYFSLRENPVGGKILGIVVSDSDNLVLYSNK